MKKIFLSALCAVVALSSCQTDMTEDLAVTPLGGAVETFDLSFSVAKSASEQTKVGFDPTAEGTITDPYLYLTDSESLALVDLNYDNAAVPTQAPWYAMTQNEEDMKTFSVSGFPISELYKVAGSIGTLEAYAISPASSSCFSINSNSLVNVTIPLANTSDSSTDYDALGATLPFVSRAISADVSWDATEEEVVFDDAVSFTLAPVFSIMNVDLANLDSDQTTAVTEVVATITLPTGNYFIGEAYLDMSEFVTEGSPTLSSVNDAGSGTGNYKSTSASMTITETSTVGAYSEKIIPIVIAMPYTAVTAYDVTVEFYNGTVLVAQVTCERSELENYTWPYGTVNTITPTTEKDDTFEYALTPAAEAVASVTATPSDTAAEITVSWTYDETTTNIAGVTIYYKKTGAETYNTVTISGADFTALDTTSPSYTLGVTEEDLDAETEYTIYLVTLNSVLDETSDNTVSGGASDNTTTATTPTVAVSCDIKLENSIYQIYTAKGLAAFSYIVNNEASITSNTVTVLIADQVATDDIETGGTITDWTTDATADAKLMNEIDLSTIYGADKAVWIPIGGTGDTAYYTGKFDGNNQTIKNLYVLGESNNLGLFGYISTGEIENLTLENPYVADARALDGDATGSYVGAYAGRGSATFTSCSVTGANAAIYGGSYVGGIVGEVSGSVVSCDNEADVTATGSRVGGIAGDASSVTSFTGDSSTHAKNSGKISGAEFVGGVVGYLDEKTISYYDNYGQYVCSTPTSNNVGGISGYGTTTTDCVDYYETNKPDAVTGVVATPNLDSETKSIVVTWDTPASTDGLTVAVYYKPTAGSSYETIAASFTATTSECTIPDASLTAGTTYDIAVVTSKEVSGVTYKTWSDTVQAKAYDSTIYSSDDLPTITATHDGTDITIEWGESVSGELQKVTIADDTLEITQDVTDFTQSVEVTGATLSTTDVTLNNCVAYFAPTASSTTQVAVNFDEITVTYATSVDIELVSDVYQIYTAKGLQTFATIVNTGLTDGEATAAGLGDEEIVQNAAASAQLMADFSLSTVCGATLGESSTPLSWTPIGTNTTGYQYTGTFDGNNKTISDLYINTADTYQGLFGYVGAGTVKNLTLTGVNMTLSAGATAYAGAVAGCLINANGYIYGCEVSGAIGSSTSATTGIGGIIGYLASGAKVESCTNNANITTVGAHVGGIVGSLRTTGNGVTSGNIIKCINKGNISAQGASIGGIVSYIQGSGTTAITECENYGTIYTTGSSSAGTCAAGIAGVAQANAASATVTFTSCINHTTGTVTTTSSHATQGTYVGGIVGQSFVRNATSTVYINSCTNNAVIDSKSGYVGGIVGGDNEATGYTSVTNSSNTAAVTGTASVGGIMGYALGNTTLYGNKAGTAKNSGAITGTDGSTGGLVGTNAGLVQYYLNSGTVNEEAASSDNLVGSDSGEHDACGTAVSDVTVTAPQAVTVTSIGSDNSGTSINVSWTYGLATDRIASVIVYYSVSKAGDYSPQVVTDLTATSTSFTATTGTTYDVYVVTSTASTTEGTQTYATDGGTTDSPKTVTAEVAVLATTEDIEYVSDAYQIKTVAGLGAFADIVNGTSVYTNIAQDVNASAVLTTSLDMSDATGDFADLATTFPTMSGYTGTFSGGGYTISNLKTTAGMFTTTSGATIKDLTLYDPMITTGGTAGTGDGNGAFVGTATSTTIQDCHVTVSTENKVIFSAQRNYTGCIVGVVSGGTVVGCTNAGVVYGTTPERNGGIAGYISNSAKVSYCLNTATFPGLRAYSGCIVGQVLSGTTVESCKNTGGITSATAAIVGGVVGHNAGTINYCINEGNIGGSQKTLGGIAGQSTGTIDGTKPDDYDTNATLYGDYGGNYNSGSVTPSNTNYSIASDIGGIVGNNSGIVKYYNNTSTATIQGNYNVGGIVGNNSGVITGDTSENNYNEAKVVAVLDTTTGGDYNSTTYYGYAGGLIGNNTGSITNYTNSGAVYNGGDGGNLLNGGATSWLVGTGTDADSTCVDEYSE